MNSAENENKEAAERNEDPLTHEPGAHPVSTGMGAAGAGVMGAAIGTAVAGPVGAVIGATVGAVVGGLGGSVVGEIIDPTAGTEFDSPPQPTQPIDDFVMAGSIGVGLMPFGTMGLSTGIVPPIGYIPEMSHPSQEEIAFRAWQIYESEGFPEGRALDHWLQAERELLK